MRLGKPVPAPTTGAAAEQFFGDDSDFEERKGYDDSVQAPQIYGKSNRSERNTFARRSAATIALANTNAALEETKNTEQSIKKVHAAADKRREDSNFRISYGQIRGE